MNKFQVGEFVAFGNAYAVPKNITRNKPYAIVKTKDKFPGSAMYYVGIYPDGKVTIRYYAFYKWHKFKGLKHD